MFKLLRGNANRLLKLLLRSPLHRPLSKGLLLISFTGRKSGKTYTTPISYLRDGDDIILFTNRERKWWRNLQGGAPVTLWVQGEKFSGVATPMPTEPEALARSQRSPFRRVFALLNPRKAAQAAQTRVMIRVERDTRSE